jgi:hypothetical protein
MDFLKKEYDCFICYRRGETSPHARAIKLALEASKVSVFLDLDDMPPGKYKESIPPKIQTAKNFIVILSKDCFATDSLKKEDIYKYEIDHAIKYDKKIIPVELDTFQCSEVKDYKGIYSYNAIKYYDEYAQQAINQIYKRLDLTTTNTPKRKYFIIVPIFLIVAFFIFLKTKDKNIDKVPNERLIENILIINSNDKTTEVIEKLVKKYSLDKPTNVNPHLAFQPGDISYWQEQNLTEKELEIQFLTRQIILYDADIVGTKIGTQGHLSALVKEFLSSDNERKKMIENFARINDLFTPTKINPHLVFQDGDISNWTSSDLSLEEILMHLKIRKDILNEADETGKRINSQGDLSFLVEEKIKQLINK